MQSEGFDSHHNRRNFLKQLGGVGTVAAYLFTSEGMARASSSKTLTKLQAILPKAKKRLPALPIDPAKSIPGLAPLITPNKDFYRIDIASQIPAINANTWSLKIHGMVKRPITLTYADLLKRPLFELDDTMSCVSNPVGGIYIGNARWLGCRLDDLIKEAGPLATADQVFSTSQDGFSAGFPLSILDGRDAMIAVGMNGAVLPIPNGYPARLVVPGLYGYVSATKWLADIEITRFDIKQGYWISRGWSRLGPVKMESRIDTPRHLQEVKVGPTNIAGVAWAPNIGIKAVQVQIDDGSWMPATLGPQLSGTSWRQWWISWNATSGRHKVSVRAINAKGEVQSAGVVDPLPNGAEGLHSINITA